MVKKTIAYVSPMFKPFIGGAEISLECLTRGLEKNKTEYLLITSLIDERGNLIMGENQKDGNILRVGMDANIVIQDSTKWKDAIVEKLVQNLIEHSSEFDIIYLNSHIFFQYPDAIKKIFSLKNQLFLSLYT